MSKILWRGKNKKTGEGTLERNFLPADPKAKLAKDKDGYYIITAEAMVSSKPVVVKK